LVAFPVLLTTTFPIRKKVASYKVYMVVIPVRLEQWVYNWLGEVLEMAWKFIR
jgi:hypothetical protein